MKYHVQWDKIQYKNGHGAEKATIEVMRLILEICLSVSHFPIIKYVTASCALVDGYSNRNSRKIDSDKYHFDDDNDVEDKDLRK